MEQQLGEKRGRSARGVREGTGKSRRKYNKESVESVLDKLSEIASTSTYAPKSDKNYWFTGEVYQLDTGLSRSLNSIDFTHAILYFAWRHLYWTQVVDPDGGSSQSLGLGRILPFRTLVKRSVSNMESIQSGVLQPVNSHLVIVEALIAMTRSKGALRFCRLETEAEEDNSYASLFGVGLGVFFDKKCAKMMHQGLCNRDSKKPTIESDKMPFIEGLRPIHHMCIQKMVEREVEALFEEATPIKPNGDEKDRQSTDHVEDSPVSTGVHLCTEQRTDGT